MKAEVSKAVGAIRAHYALLPIDASESSCGGVYVTLHDVPLGPPYAQPITWVGFFITNACPHADVYPFYVRPDLSRLDGVALKVPLHRDRIWVPGPDGTTGRPAVMVSRRQRHSHCWGRETPLLKLQTVLAWMLQQ